MKLFGWLRLRLGCCEMGHGLLGCWRSPVWRWWAAETFSVGLCEAHRFDMFRAIAGDHPERLEWIG